MYCIFQSPYAGAMSTSILLALSLSIPTPSLQEPSSQPASRPSGVQSVQERLLPADWGKDAPGKAVMPKKFLPIKTASYGSRKDVEDKVRDEDLIIGIEMGKQAYAYPINMLGGPHREIVNQEFAGVAFCVNW